MEATEPPTTPIPECQADEYAEVAWGVEKFKNKFTAFNIPRPNVRANDVKFELLYCGICHTDVHQCRNDWKGANYPMVPGHELLGRVVEVGASVTKFKVGDAVGVGCFIGSCRDCESCKAGDEQYCYKGMVSTYNGAKQHAMVGGNQETKTFGGYSGSNVVHEDYVIKVPEGADLAKTGPILCAGITMYSPLVHWGCKEGGKTVGVVGIGGLGTMGVKLAKALGNKVVAISTSGKKEAMAREKGADEFVVSTDPESVKKHAMTCDVILNTVSAPHDVNTYLPLLKKNSTLVQLGGVMVPHQVNQFGLMFNRQQIAGSLIGGVRETQEVVDLCAAKNIYPDCEMIEAKDIDASFDKLEQSNADAIRYVIDIKKSLENKDFVPA